MQQTRKAKLEIGVKPIDTTIARAVKHHRPSLPPGEVIDAEVVEEVTDGNGGDEETRRARAEIDARYKPEPDRRALLRPVPPSRPNPMMSQTDLQNGIRPDRPARRETRGRGSTPTDVER